jgi:hypothetical protein
MSAAEPVDQGPDHALMATVTPIVRTAARPPRREKRREALRVPQQPTAGLTPHEKMAAWLEDLFAGHSRSLTESETAEAFLTTLSAVRTVLVGARKKGRLSEEAFVELDALLEGMMTAPGLLARPDMRG